MDTDDPIEVQRLASRIAGAVQIQAIILRELEWTMPEQNIPPGLPIDLRPQFNAQAALTPELVIYKIETNVSAVIPDELEIFRLKAVYQAVFSYPEGMEFSRDEVEAFGATSGMLMVFPYVRETLQTTAAKAGIPAVLLQPLRLPFVPPDGATPASAEDMATSRSDT